MLIWSDEPSLWQNKQMTMTLPETLLYPSVKLTC